MRLPCQSSLPLTLLPLLAAIGALATATPRSARAEDISAPPSSYHEAILRTCAGGSADAEAALALFEASRLDPADLNKSVDQLSGEELALLGIVGRSLPEAMLPVLELHVSARASYPREARGVLLGHSQRLVAAGVEHYLEVSRISEKNEAASWILTRLGADVLRTRARRSAELILQRALALDSSNALAALGLGALYEKQASYERAVPLLEQAVAADAGLAEARLRLAVNLHRVGRSQEATSHFQSLLRSGAPPWILSLAYQEQARLYMSLQQWDRARSTLSAGVERFPGDERLIIQLSYVLERGGQPWEGQRLAAGVIPSTVAVHARDRYNRYPTLEAAPDVVVRVETWIRSHRRSLCSTLGRSAEGAP